MQDIDRFFELGHEHDAKDAACIPDADLSRPTAYLNEGLPVCRFEPGLNPPQLKAGFPPGTWRKGQQIVVGGTYPTDLPVPHPLFVYKILYIPAVRVEQSEPAGIAAAPD